MKTFCSYSHLLCRLVAVAFSALLVFEAQALTFDCRDQEQPSEGYFIYIGYRGPQIQSIYSESLKGPLYYGELQRGSRNQFFIIRTEMTHHTLPGIFEFWVPFPRESSPYFDVDVFFYGTYETPLNERELAQKLTCYVQSETAPRIFKSEI